MEQYEVIEHFENIKLTMQKQFPKGKWQPADDPHVKEFFSIKFVGAKKSEKMTVYHTGNINFQGGPNNGARLKNYCETLSVQNLLISQKGRFGDDTRAFKLDREFKECYGQNLPNAAALLMKSILEYLWKQAFGDTGFADDKMKQAAEGEKDIKPRHLATFRQIRVYGNGVTHENVWNANMEHIVGIKGQYEQLVDALLAIKKRQN
ncbi:hypothetical protein N8860_04475 [Alphaproteobacteria bacterium]|nr:hypothetical protein [Alphaproteobacteria bacterium]